MTFWEHMLISHGHCNHEYTAATETYTDLHKIGTFGIPSQMSKCVYEVPPLAKELLALNNFQRRECHFS